MEGKNSSTKSMREIIGLEFNSSKVILLVTDVGQGKIVGLFSNVVKGVETYAYAWAKYPAVQIYLKLAKRCCNEIVTKTMLE